MKNRQTLSVLITILFLLAFLFCMILKLSTGRDIEQVEILDIHEKEEIRKIKVDIVKQQKFMHISFDDFILSFEDITKNKDVYDSIFDNEVFAFYKELHDKYGVVISCYVFYENNDSGFTLADCTDKFKQEFANNSTWLRFGFHSLKGDISYEDSNANANVIVRDYKKTISELLRITGSKDCIDNIVRLQSFYGNKECLENLMKTENGVIGVLTSDDKRMNYYLNIESNSYIYHYDFFKDYNGLLFFKTDFRYESIDYMDDIFNLLSKDKDNSEMLFTFTHEWQLNNNSIKEKIEESCIFAIKNNYLFDFPENRIY